MDCTNSEIHDLLIQLQQGNIEAAGQIFACIVQKLVKRVIDRGCSREDADDIAQETMIRIIKGINTYNKRGAWGWIWRIHSNVTIDFFRKNLKHQERAQSLVQIDEDTLVSEDDPEGEVVIDEFNEELTKALNYMFSHISEEDQKILLSRMSKEDQEELLTLIGESEETKPPKRGTKPQAWHEAADRAHRVLEDYNRDAKS